MKTLNQDQSKLWLEAENALTLKLQPEDLRTSGLLAAQRMGWSSALLRLEEAVQNGVRDFQTLDALGEAAYRAKMSEALLPFKELYRDPMISIHMARALMMLGQSEEAEEFLKISKGTTLKTAVSALLGMRENIESAIKSMLRPFTGKNQTQIENLNFAEYWQALAPVAEAAGRADLVSLAERRSKALAYDKAVIHYNQALRLLAAGEFRAGWKLYDWGLAPGSPCESATGFADIAMWEGELLQGKSLLIVLENGLGDQIFGLRYLQSMADEGAQVEIAVDEELHQLVQNSFPLMKVHELKKAREENYWQFQPRPDYWSYCLSLPCRADICEPIGTTGFLSAPKNLSQTYKKLIASVNPDHLPVYGITWHGDIRTAPMRTRAYTLEEFLKESEILNKPSLIVCLQKDVTHIELAELQIEIDKVGGKLINAAPQLEDFAHTAAWIKCLDHMFSCDTAVAHAAGALGTPTTVLIRNKAIWQWRSNNDKKSVWYDSAQIKYALAPKFSYMFEIPD